MKNLILFITLIASSFIGFSQQLEQVLIELKQKNNWELNERLLHTYDDNDFLESTICQSWFNESHSWLNKTKTSYTRTKTGTSIQNRIEHWNAGIENWVFKNKTTFALDEKDRVIESIRQEWKNEDWIETKLTLTSYDSFDNVKSKQYFYKKTPEDTWKLINSYVYKYSDTGEIESYLYDSPTKKMRSSYSRDTKGKLINVIKEEYKDGIWEIYSKEEQHYHHAHGLDFTISKLWLEVNQEWYNNSKSSYLKDMNGLIEQNIGYEWLKNKKSWNMISRYTYTYKVEQTQLEKRPVAIKVYPNPTMKLINIDHLTSGIVTIINANGKQVYRSKNDDVHLEINVQSFPEGYYFIRLNDESIGNFVKVN